MSKRLITIISHPAPFWAQQLTSGNAAFQGPEIRITGVKISGTGWDDPINAEDITPDGRQPTSTTVSSHIVLGYTTGMGAVLGVSASVFPPSMHVSIRRIRVTFTSGHQEEFEIPIHLKNFYGASGPWFNMNFSALGVGGTSGLSFAGHADYINTQPLAAIDPNTGLPVNNFYSLAPDHVKSLNQNGGTTLINHKYSIFTKYSGDAYTNGSSFTQSEILTNFRNGYSGAKLYTSFPQGTGISSGHNDRIAMNYGVSGFTTPANIPGRQEFHRIDFLLQRQNSNWNGDLETQNGVFMDLPNMSIAMDNNLGPGQGYLTNSFTGNHTSVLDPNILTADFINAEVFDSLHTTVISWNNARELVTRGHDATAGINPDYHFVYRIYYADNLQPPQYGPFTTTYDVCDSPGDPLYYLSTSKDCSGATIPAADLPGGANHSNVIFNSSPQCCFVCPEPRSDLTFTCASVNINGASNDDGTITISHVNDDPTNPASLVHQFTTGSLYTYNVTLSNGATLTQTMPPTGGNTITVANCVTNTTSGTAHLVTCPSNAVIAPGMQVSGSGIPAGTVVDDITGGTLGAVTQFSLSQIYSAYTPGQGILVDATAAATVTLTFSAGVFHQFGALEPNSALGQGVSTSYVVEVTDVNGCSVSEGIYVKDCVPTDGCTDSNAINYSSGAANDDGSCLFCDAATGKLEDSTGADLSDIFTNVVVNATDMTIGCPPNFGLIHCDEGTISVQATIDPALQSYISLGATETYTMTLHSITTPGDPTTSTGVVATQTGISSVINGYSPVHMFTGLAYGHYAIKIQFVDSNHVLEEEECFTWAFATVYIPVCLNPPSPNYASQCLNSTCTSTQAVPSAFWQNPPQTQVPNGPWLCSPTTGCQDCCSDIYLDDGAGGPISTGYGYPIIQNGMFYSQCGASGATTAPYGNTFNMGGIYPVNIQCNPLIKVGWFCDWDLGGSYQGQQMKNEPEPNGWYLHSANGGGYMSTVWLFNGTPVPAPMQQVSCLAAQGTYVKHPYGNLGWTWFRSNPTGVPAPHLDAAIKTETQDYTGATNNMGCPSEDTALGPSFMQQLGSGQICNELWFELSDGTICSHEKCYNYTQFDDGCLDPAATNYNASATCPGPCIYESYDCDPVTGYCFDPGDGSGPYPTIQDCQVDCTPPPTSGCTDPCAVNYDAGATIDDGTCEYKACLDPTASNYQFSCDCGIDLPTATINDQNCCIFPCANQPNVTLTVTDATGTCTTPLADGSVTIIPEAQNGATHFNIIITDVNGLVVFDQFATNGTYITSGSTFTYSQLLPGPYTVLFIDSLGCEHEEQFPVSVNDPTSGCTDPLASNYNPLATCDDGSCIYKGCTDPKALNYNPNAITDDGSCVYCDTISNPCVPKYLENALLKLRACLSQKGSKWLTNYKIGTNVDCSTMNKWKLILLEYVLQKKDLSCLFNCADNATPSVDDLIYNCSDLWIKGGGFTGLNDAATSGATVLGSSWTSGEGTTITDPAAYFVAGQKLSLGDVIKMPSGLIWKVVSIATQQIGPQTFDLKNLNPETATGIASGNWAQCLNECFPDAPTTSVNYYDNFLKFVNKYCNDCKIPPAWKQKNDY